jgi:hypothetical protein
VVDSVLVYLAAALRREPRTSEGEDVRGHVVRAGGEAQDPYRDYHVGFLENECREVGCGRERASLAEVS